MLAAITQRIVAERHVVRRPRIFADKEHDHAVVTFPRPPVRVLR